MDQIKNNNILERYPLARARKALGLNPYQSVTGQRIYLVFRDHYSAIFQLETIRAAHFHALTVADFDKLHLILEESFLVNLDYSILEEAMSEGDQLGDYNETSNKSVEGDDAEVPYYWNEEIFGDDD